MRLPLMLALALLLGCNRREEQAPTPRPTGPVTLESAWDKEVIPTTDGAAYIISTAGLWYVRGREAIKVRSEDTEGSSEGLSGVYDLELIPTADGSAYVLSRTGGAWYLRNEVAFRVVESARIKSEGPKAPLQESFFSQYVAELKRRRTAEDELERIMRLESEEDQF